MNANANSTPKANGQTVSELPFTEAPASWNTRYLDPSGFECQITLRGETGQELLEKATGAIAFLLKNGCSPCTNNKGYGRNNTYKPNANSTQANSNGHSDNGNGANAANTNEAPNICPIHQCEMKRWDKDGRVWYSHKTQDGQWCRGK